MTDKHETTNPRELLLILVLCAICSLVIWFPLAKHNLPVAANGDETTGWSIIDHFYSGDLNPHFFLYPTLYYYVDYFLTLPFGNHNVLFSGRILNLLLIGVAAAATYFLALSGLKKRVAAVVAAAFILFSQLFAASGAYLCTDVLLAALSVAAIAFLLRYFDEHRTRDWLAGMALCGLSVACKYTAFVLFIAYVVAEVAGFSSDEKNRAGFMAWRVPKICLVVILLAGGILLCVGAAIFPTDWAMAFIQAHRTNVNSKDTAGYLLFFRSLRIQLTLLGAGALALDVLLARFDGIWQRISPSRLYLGLGVVLAICLVTTPFTIVTPVRFIYDVGAMLKNNVDVPGGHTQWGNYLRWFFEYESLVSGILALVGAALLLREWRRLGLLYIYAVLYILVIGASHRGFPRYLIPLLPILFCMAGYAIAVMVGRKNGRWIAACIFLPLTFWCVVHIRQVRRAAYGKDEAYNTYMLLKEVRPRKLYFAGDAPSEALKNAGFQVQEISSQKVQSAEFWDGLDCRDAVILDRRNSGPPIASRDGNAQPSATRWRRLNENAHAPTEDVYLKETCN